MSFVCSYFLLGVRQSSVSGTLVLGKGDNEITIAYFLSAKRFFTASLEVSNAARSRIISNISFSKKMFD